MLETETKQGEQSLPLLYLDDFILDSEEEGPGNTLTLGEGWVIAFTGIRGSGKSLSMAYTIAAALIKGLTVWSNMSVAFKCCHGPGNVKSYSTKPLNFDALYALQGDVSDGVVAIDELQYYADSRTSLTLRNRMINAIIYQIRKRRLDFYYTVKALEWLDKRLRFWETDIEIACWDRSKGSGGLPRGKNFLWNIYDHSGAWTGRPWIPKTPPTTALMLDRADRLWPIYETEEIIDYFDAQTPVRLDLQERVISNRESYQTKRVEDLQALVSDFKGQGKNEVPVDEFCAVAGAVYGLNADPMRIGRDLVKLGVTRKRTRAGSFYNLEYFKNIGG